LESGVDATEKSDEIDDLFRGSQVETDTRPKGVFQARSLGDLTELIGLAHYLGYACVGLVLALVATTTVMSVQDRIKEHAVLQTLGFTGFRVFRLVLSESVLLSTAGGILGVGAAMLILALSRLAVGAEAVTIAFRPSWTLAATGIIVSALVGIFAGVAPGWHAARTEIVAALRA
jgi:putative ABC transport system permease protein